MAGGGQGDDLGEVLSSPVVQELRKERDQIAKEIAELEGRYGPRHPELLKAERQRAEIDGQIRQEIGRLVSNLKVQAEVARSREAAVGSALDESEGGAWWRTNDASVGLKELQRNLESVRAVYQSFLDRFKQTSAQDGMAQSDARLISPAKAPGAAARPEPTSAAGFRALALITALAAGRSGHMVRGGLGRWSLFGGRHQAKVGDGLPDYEFPLAHPPKRPPSQRQAAARRTFSPIDWILDQPFSSFSESFRTLKAALATYRAHTHHILAVTSAYPGEGKTTTCLSLGRALARSGRWGRGGRGLRPSAADHQSAPG